MLHISSVTHTHLIDVPQKSHPHLPLLTVMPLFCLQAELKVASIAPYFTHMMGHSLGEFSALVAGGNANVAIVSRLVYLVI
jgi:malonyl CoA-acyl carrier protein transacylase